MQCGVREVRRQEVIEKRLQCFKCGEEGHKKWECPQMKERKREEVVLPHKVWEKIREHCGAKGHLSRGAVMSMEGWTTR